MRSRSRQLSVKQSLSAGVAALLLAMLPGCDHPRILDGQAAAYCETQGLPRGTDANADCALKREEELEATGKAPPPPVVPASLIASLPAPVVPSAASQTLPTSVVQGKMAMVSFFFSPTCDATGLPTVTVEKQPKHGVARIVRRDDDPRLSRTIAPAACSKSKVPGIAVEYTAQRDYAGDDSLEIATMTPSGVRTAFKIPLTVETPPTLDDIDP
jgi:hypothetical protein